MTRRPAIPCHTLDRALRRLACSTVGALGLLSVLTTRVSLAGAPADVEALIRQGVELRQKNQDHAALPVFQRAYDLSQTPRTAAQLGLAEASLGYWIDAERHLSEALVSGHQPWVDRNRPLLERTLKDVKSAIGELAISVLSPGAEVSVNGKSVGKIVSARSIRLVDGVANVVARAKGYNDYSASFQVVGGQRRDLVITMTPRKVAVSGRPKRAVPVLGPATSALESPSAQAGWIRPAAWTTAGLAVLGVGVGAYGLANMWHFQDEFNGTTIDGARVCDAKLPERGPPPCGTLYEKSVSSQRLAILGAQVGGLLGIAATIGFLWSSRSEPETNPGVSLFVDETGGGLRGTF